MEKYIIFVLFDNALIVLIYMSIWFVFSLIKKRNDVADIAWGLGFVTIGISTLFLNNNFSSVYLLVLGLVLVWGLRLFWHIAKRNIKKEEDARYKKWRQQWGRSFILRSYLQVFLLQGFLMFLIAMPVMVLGVSPTNNINFLVIFGLVVWSVGFFFESVGDRQLKKFLSDPSNKGKIMNKGLWHYTRHPNYFGEVVMWWGIWFISLSAGYIWFTFLGPITITFLILFVSGIPMTEKNFENKSGWNEYKKKTSVFLPLPPKK